ncbi:MAG: PilZ domain-containing protein [Candidatus Omnitrophota bacterium]|nr:MAG: PilZ domain-containing protein [Candidatus Omnitrophota bacterium]
MAENEQEKYEGFDRRLFPRLDVNALVEYAVVKILPLKEKGASRDISAGGICFTVSEDLKIDTALSLTIHLPDGGTPVKAKGKVVRKIEAATGPGEKKEYEIGVEFTRIKAKDQERIAKYVRQSNI